MSPRVPIGDLVDHDSRLYSFERNSRLPRHTFDERSERWGDWFVVAVCVVGFIVALCMGWGGQ